MADIKQIQLSDSAVPLDIKDAQARADIADLQAEDIAIHEEINSLVSGLLDFFYPVGSYYETSKTQAQFDPNISWGGTWVLETSGRVHVSAGTGYTIGASGGNKDAIIPYHTHSLSRTTNAAVSLGGSGTLTAASAGAHTHTMKAKTDYASHGSWKGVHHEGTSTYPTSSAGAHTHSIPSHNHSVSVTQPAFSCAYTGVSVTNANMPPYITVNRWHRTA